MKNQDVKIYLLLLLFSFGLLAMGDNPRIQTGKALGKIAFYPFQKGITLVRDLMNLQMENRDLQNRLVELSFENQFLKEFRYENENLRKMLSFKEKGNFELLPAEVIGRSPGGMNQTVLIDRGKGDGIKLNMPVVTYDGVVGKVIEVSNNTSLIQTLFDRNSRVSALIQRSRGLGIIRWQGGTALLLDNVAIQEDIVAGDQIISSGLGEIFPQGLLIGTVREVREGRRGLFHEITVEPVVGSKVEEVFIILKETKPKSSPGDDSSKRKQENPFISLSPKPEEIPINRKE